MSSLQIVHGHHHRDTVTLNVGKIPGILFFKYCTNIFLQLDRLCMHMATTNVVPNYIERDSKHVCVLSPW